MFPLTLFLGCESKSGTSCDKCLGDVNVSLDNILSLSLCDIIVLICIYLYIFLPVSKAYSTKEGDLTCISENVR